MNAEARELREHIAALEAENTRLKAEVERLGLLLAEESAHCNTFIRREARRSGALLRSLAAECHRHKWKFSPPDHETDPPIGCAEARRLVGRAFDVLHALGDKIMAAEAEIRACGERKGDA